MFITVIALISLVAVVWIVWPLVLTKKDASPDLQSVNSKLLEDQMAELEYDLEQGTIDQSQHEAARLDLQRTFLDTATVSEIQPSLHAKSNPLLIMLIVVILPISAYLIYKQIGVDYTTIKYMADQPKGSTQAAGHNRASEQDIDAMLVAVRKKAEADPDDIDSWMMLAQILHIMKDTNGAVKAYHHLIEKKGVEEAEIYANYADVLATQEGGILVGSPAYEWVQKALDLDPNHQQALWIAGTAAYYSKEYDVAKSFWDRLLILLEPASDSYNVIQKNLAQMAQEQEASM